jgi:hypothetical protein
MTIDDNGRDDEADHAEATSDIGQFAIVPLWLAESGVSSRAVHVYAIMSAKWVDRSTATCYPKRQTIATALDVSVDTIDRAMRELVKVGAVEIRRRKSADRGNDTNTYRVRVVRPAGRNDAATTGRKSAATPGRKSAAQNKNQGEQQSLEQDGDDVVTDAAPPRDHADEIARHVWENRSPRPATPFVAVRKIARSLIDAGHDPAVVRDAMMNVRTISIAWCESWINDPKRRPAAQTGIDSDRGGPEGGIDL